jgi:peptide deformylase
MDAANGVGLAAQQVGVPLQLAGHRRGRRGRSPSTMTIDGQQVKLENTCRLVLLNPQLETSEQRTRGARTGKV